MFRRIFGAAIGAGMAVGMIVALLQQVALVPIILGAEVYESHGTATHPHSQLAPANYIAASVADLAASLISPARAHESHDTPALNDQSLLVRHILTWLATTLTSVGFAFLLAGAFAVSGREIDWREGLLWGLAGFAAFALAPAFGLPPELPGSVAADLVSRQIWWVGTVAATLAGLGLLVFVRTAWTIPIGIGLLLAPHIIGAPYPHGGAGVVPPKLAASFAARSLGINAIFWVLLGLTTGWLYEYFNRAPVEI